MADLHSSSFLTLTPRRSSFHSLSGMHGSVHSRLKGSETWDLCQQFLSGKSPNLCIIIIFSAVLQPLAKILDLQSNCFVSVSSLSKWRRPPREHSPARLGALDRGVWKFPHAGVHELRACVDGLGLIRVFLHGCLFSQIDWRARLLNQMVLKDHQRPEKAVESVRLSLAHSIDVRGLPVCTFE